MKKVMTMLSVIVAAICMTSCGNTANDQTSVTDANKQVMEQFIRFINTGRPNHRRIHYLSRRNLLCSDLSRTPAAASTVISPFST